MSGPIHMSHLARVHLVALSICICGAFVVLLAPRMPCTLTWLLCPFLASAARCLAAPTRHSCHRALYLHAVALSAWHGGCRARRCICAFEPASKQASCRARARAHAQKRCLLSCTAQLVSCVTHGACHRPGLEGRSTRALMTRQPKRRANV